MEFEDTVPFSSKLSDLLNDHFFKKRLVLWYHFEKHLIPRQIFEETGIAIQSIRDWINRWTEEGSIEDHKGKGRHIEISPSAKKKIVQIQGSDRTMPATSVYRETIATGHEVSYRQTLGVINDTFITVKAPYKIQLRDDNKRKRIALAEMMLSWRLWKVHNVVWTDEKNFQLYPEGKIYKVKLLPGESPDDFSVPRVQQGGQKVMFYAAISGKGKVHFCTLKGKIDSDIFSKFLKVKVLPSIQKLHGNIFMLQQDNAPAHAGETKQFIKKEEIETLDWPAQSPDLNPVEQVWFWMERDIHSKSFKNITELENYVYSLWEKLEKDMILSFIDKLLVKLDWVLKNQGEIYPG
jgi:transposase